MNEKGDIMPNTPAAKKALRQNKKRKERNKKTKKGLKALIKDTKSLIAEKKFDEAKEIFRKVQAKLDKATSKKILKKGKINREKSRLAKKIAPLDSH